MPFAVPVVVTVALISVAVRLSQTAFLLKLQPDKFQGAHKRMRYFEGWYYKFVSPDGDEDGGGATSMAVVPGIFYGDSPGSNESHAFVFLVLDGERQHYYRFPTSEFGYASPSEEYYVRVGGNLFTHSGASIDLSPREGDDASLALRGDLAFSGVTPWPVSLTGLGAMGFVGWIPGLECSHGVLSFDHVLNGSLNMNMTSHGEGGGTDEEETASPSSTVISFDGGRGYAEKDWGRSFPSLWIWLQSNSFRENPGTSLFVSVARVPLPLLGLGLPGFTAAVRHDGTLIPFALWSGARFEELCVSEAEIYIVMKSCWWKKCRHRVEIAVDRRGVPEALLYAPVNFERMAPFVREALQARVHMRLWNGNDLVVDDFGGQCGLEVRGDAGWLADNVCGKETAGRIVCL